MAKGSSPRKRIKPKDNGRKAKKKISPLSSESVSYVDYKDVELLKRFMSDRAKIRSRRVSGNDSQQQRQVARAIKNAREMGLLAYTSRVTTQRRGGGGGGGGRSRDARSDQEGSSGDFDSGGDVTSGNGDGRRGGSSRSEAAVEA
jgi:small subunit ribosomal protein S18